MSCKKFPYRYSEHAKKRKFERSISDLEVKECIENCETMYTDKCGNPVYRAKVNGRGIKVVIALAEPDFIITVADYQGG